MLDLKKIRKSIDEALANETSESMKEFLNKCKANEFYNKVDHLIVVDDIRYTMNLEILTIKQLKHMINIIDKKFSNEKWAVDFAKYLNGILDILDYYCKKLMPISSAI